MLKNVHKSVRSPVSTVRLWMTFYPARWKARSVTNSCNCTQQDIRINILIRMRMHVHMCAHTCAHTDLHGLRLARKPEKMVKDSTIFFQRLLDAGRQNFSRAPHCLLQNTKPFNFQHLVCE